VPDMDIAPHPFQREYPNALRCSVCNLPLHAAPHGSAGRQLKINPDLHPAFVITRGGLTREQWAHWFMSQPGRSMTMLKPFEELLDFSFRE
jgi:hypothetical protein